MRLLLAGFGIAALAVIGGIFADALERPGVRARVAELRGHPHRWVAEAASQLGISD
jgi:hypothetical protein